MQLILCAKQAISLRLAYFNSSPSDTFFWSPLFLFPELVSDLLPEQNDWLRLGLGIPLEKPGNYSR